MKKKEIVPPVKSSALSSLFRIPPELRKYFEMLIASISIIGIIWGAGAFFNDMSSQIKMNKEDISNLKIEIKDTRNELNKNILYINELNNRVWNNKLLIYFKYNNDRDLINTLLEEEDSKYQYELSSQIGLVNDTIKVKPLNLIKPTLKKNTN